MPIIAGASSGLRRTSAIRLCSSATVFVAFEVLDEVVAGAGAEDGATEGDCEGAGVGDGEGVTDGVAGAVDLRSRCVVALKLPTGIAVSKRTSERNNLEIFISVYSSHSYQALAWGFVAANILRSNVRITQAKAARKSFLSFCRSHV